MSEVLSNRQRAARTKRQRGVLRVMLRDRLAAMQRPRNWSVYAFCANPDCCRPFPLRKGGRRRFCSRLCIGPSPGRLAAIRALWDEGLSTSKIGARFGITKGVVIGIAHRNEFPERPSPIVRRPA